MQILVLNCGSSSVKFMVIQMPGESVLFRGLAEKYGDGRLRFFVKSVDGNEKKIESSEFDYTTVFDHIFETVHVNSLHKQISDIQIDAVGHRLVHGGEGISEGQEITPELLSRMREMVSLAPLHYPANLAGIDAVFKKIPGILQVGIFDTAFHQTIPPFAFHYGIPMKYYTDYGIRRYGFHGTSHQYVAQRACSLLDMDIQHCRIITCHLGNGASVAAIRDGKSVDTSMGFTPLEGLIMGTRPGDMDPGAILYIMKKENLTPDAIESVLNRECGLLGISEISSDIRVVLEMAKKGNINAKLAIDAYIYRIKKYIGAYTAVLGGLDILVFTGGIGENSAIIRKEICQGLDFLGIGIDDGKNSQSSGGENQIGSDLSAVRVLVIPSNEELMIARETMKLFMKKHQERGKIISNL